MTEKIIAMMECPGTLRDWFAVNATEGDLHKYLYASDGCRNAISRAEGRYAHADEMLKVGGDHK